MFEVGDRVRTGKFSRYGRREDGTISRIDEDGTIFGRFDGGGTFMREGEMVRDLELADEE